MNFFETFDQEDPTNTLRLLQEKTKDCRACALHSFRTNVVFGEGNHRPDILCLGEAPADLEDKHGRPFIGPTGYKLDECLQQVGLAHSSVYRAYVVMCQPEENRRPDALEIKTCAKYLLSKISVLRPKIILAFGLTAATALLKREFQGIEGVRRNWYSYGDIPLRFTYSLAFMMKLGEGQEREVELIDDFKAVKIKLMQLNHG